MANTSTATKPASAAKPAASRKPKAATGASSARSAARDAAAKGSAAVDDVRQEMEGLIDRASGELDRIGETARTQGASFANAQKARSAETIGRVAENLRAYGDDLDDSPEIQSVIDGAAERLDEIAGQLRSKSFGDLYRDVEDFAREQPLTVAAGALLLGFAAARLLQNSDSRRT